MINIQKLIEEANENGYHGDKASAKVCQDIVLKALSIGPLSRNVTIKGGVVMRSKTNNVRRATQDLDIDFIKNSDEQMLAEKLRSLLKFGPFSTRYKDVYDMYYLKDSVDRVKLMVALDTYIFNDTTMKENTGNDIVRRLKITFSDKGYIGRLDTSDKRWIDEEISVVTNGLLEFVAKI